MDYNRKKKGKILIYKRWRETCETFAVKFCEVYGEHAPSRDGRGGFPPGTAAALGRLSGEFTPKSGQFHLPHEIHLFPTVSSGVTPG